MFWGGGGSSLQLSHSSTGLVSTPTTWPTPGARLTPRSLGMPFLVSLRRGISLHPNAHCPVLKGAGTEGVAVTISQQKGKGSASSELLKGSSTFGSDCSLIRGFGRGGRGGSKGQVWPRHCAPAAPAFTRPSSPSQFLARATGQSLFRWPNVLLPILPGLGKGTRASWFRAAGLNDTGPGEGGGGTGLPGIWADPLTRSENCSSREGGRGDCGRGGGRIQMRKIAEKLRRNCRKSAIP